MGKNWGINKCFATTVRGLEQELVNELITLGAKDIVIRNAGVEFKADFESIIKINMGSRIASRVLWQVATARYANEDDIYQMAHMINWQEYFKVEKSIKVSTTAIKSPVKSLEFLTLKVKDAVCDKFSQLYGVRPNVDKANPDIRLYLFLTEDTQTLYIDTSGEALFKRGYRDAKLEAPLKENLAAGLLALAKYDGTTPFYDPMCGSGTIAIEAAMIALNIAPGLHRGFAFENILDYPEAFYTQHKSMLLQVQQLDKQVEIYASDISYKAIEVTKDNVFKAGLADYISINRKDFLESDKPSDSGMLLTNLPYGVRLQDEDELAVMYPFIGDSLKKNYTNWNTFWLTSDLRFAKLVRLTPKRKTPVFNGSLECRLYNIPVVNGSNRKVKE